MCLAMYIEIVSTKTLLYNLSKAPDLDNSLSYEH